MASSRALHPIEVVCIHQRDSAAYKHIIKGNTYNVIRNYSALYYCIQDDKGYNQLVPKMDFMIVDYKEEKVNG